MCTPTLTNPCICRYGQEYEMGQNGRLFHVIPAEKANIELVTSDHFRPAEHLTPIIACGSQPERIFSIVFTTPASRVDIILNDKHLVFFYRHQAFMPSRDGITYFATQVISQPDVNCFIAFDLHRFYPEGSKPTLGELSEKVKNARVNMWAGIFEFKMPLDS